MFKSVLIIIFVVIILFVMRTVLQRLKSPTARVKPAVPDSRDTVQCLHCKTYIPRGEAIISGDKSFCSTQHLNDWNQST